MGRAGQRCALNLPGFTKKEVKRGTLLTCEGGFVPTNKIEAMLTLFEDTNWVIKNHTRLHLFIGTRHLLCRVKLAAGVQIGPGEQNKAVLLLEEACILCETDPFILRSYSPEETIGGGIVQKAHPDVYRLYEAGRVDSVWDTGEFARYLGCRKEEIVANLVLTTPVLQLQNHGRSFSLPAASLQLCRQRLFDYLRAYRNAHPYGVGISRTQLIQAIFGENKHSEAKREFEDAVIKALFAEGILYPVEDCYSEIPLEKIPRNSQFLKIHAQIMKQLTQSGYHFIEEKELLVRDDQKRHLKDILILLEKEGQVLRLEPGIYTTPALVKQAENQAKERGLQIQQIKTSELKDLLFTSRKQADRLRRYWKHVFGGNM